MTQPQDQPTEVQVDKDRIAQEVGRVPGQQADRYPLETHLNNATRMYNAPTHEVAGAIAWAKAQDSKLERRVHFTVDEVKGWLTSFLKQEDQSHKAALEARKA